MPDNLEQPQSALKRTQQDPSRRRWLDWLRVVAVLGRLARVVGVLILLGVAGSAIRPHVQKIKELVQPMLAPVAPASAPAVVPSPALLTNTPNPLKRPAVTSAPAPTRADSPLARKVGDIFAVASWEYCVNAAAWHKSLEVAGRRLSPQPGHEFLAVSLTICNMGEQAAIAPPLRLVGPDDAQYEPDFKAGPGASLAIESLGVDRHYKRQVVFEVPAGKPYRLVLQGGGMSDKQVIEIGR